MSALPRRNIGSRACDACKVRKVRCSEEPPCTRCSSAGISCTFTKQAKRGPRSLRAKTLREIQESQNPKGTQGPGPHSSNTGRAADDTPPQGIAPAGQSPTKGEPCVVPGRDGGSSGAQTTPVSSLIIRLCIYRLRLFPVWPILDAEELIASLLKDPTDRVTYTLANAVCSATIVQLRLPLEGRTDDNDPATAASMAAECQTAKSLLQHVDGDGGPDASLNMVRIAFFQHIYHENQSPGGIKSLIFLREAITVAQIMGLHRKASYVLLAPEEQQLRRRTLWLLFVTERGVAMLHKLPVVLQWQPSFPQLVDKVNIEVDEAHILPAFKKLVHLFWLADQSGALDLLTQADDDTQACQESRLEHLQHRLQEISSDECECNDVQRADICVTKCWMQAVVWRASLRRSNTALLSEQDNQVSQPHHIVADFLAHICRCSKTALEAHGPTMELKIFEIASALAESIYTLTAAADMARLHSIAGVRPVEMLVRLQRLLASSRGGNKTLLTLLCARIEEAEGVGPRDLAWGPQTDARDVHDDELGDRPFRSNPLPSSESWSVDTVARLDDPLRLQHPAWANHFRQETSQHMFDVAANEGAMETLEIMPPMLMTQDAYQSWDEWAVGVADMSPCAL